MEIQVLALVASAVLCALLGLSVYQHARAHALQVERGLRPTQARVLQPPYSSGSSGEQAQVSWTAPDGSSRQGIAGVSGTVQVGSRVQIWIDGNGNAATGPATTSNIVGTAILTGLLVMIGADVALVSAGAMARSRLNRRDETAWDKEWLVYEPVWSRRA
ncbi:hypothetical protein DN069_01900 [Streptacidiphilus pinicola]|uniref:Integral membrane protein n=1 Tax=Streptacidiphilus pinicola TaxID=2219663 RepID=A0A2X0KE40_9ACTN|nr:hypothetical protein DN069_01900 [Streptacidiphilus pinicola]